MLKTDLRSWFVRLVVLIGLAASLLTPFDIALPAADCGGASGGSGHCGG